MKILKQTQTELSLHRINWNVGSMLIGILPLALIGALLFAGMNARDTTSTITCQRDTEKVHCQRRLNLMGDLPKYRRSMNDVQSVKYKTTGSRIPGLVNSQLIVLDAQGKEEILYSSTLIPLDKMHT